MGTTVACQREEDFMKKKLKPLSLNRETVRCLASATLAEIAGGETGSNPHSVCATCSCLNCLNPTA
jgi:hypothetical protein